MEYTVDSDSRTILIVDDLEVNRALMADYIQALGFSPITAENGREALDAIDGQQPDMVLLDIHMPVMNGKEVLAALKKSGRVHEIPVVVVSAVEEQESLLECIRLGAFDYLMKPFNPVLLRARIEACLERKIFRDREKKLLDDLTSSYQTLKQTESARDALSNMIVHDLSNPLAVVAGYSELLNLQAKNGSLDEHTLDDGLTRIANAAKDMTRLVMSILDVAKLESGQMEVALDQFDAVSLIGNICDDMTVRAEQAKVNLSFASEDESLLINSDRELLSRVIQNLISNSIKHNGGQQAEIRVSVSSPDASLRISVKDNGKGIPRDLCDRVFEKYFQAATGQTRIFGVGLGLTFCRMAVKALKGEIRVESDEGRGADFIVKLPRNNTSRATLQTDAQAR